MIIINVDHNVYLKPARNCQYVPVFISVIVSQRSKVVIGCGQKYIDQ